MTLSKATPRELVHSREIRCRGYRREDGLWDIDGSFEDTKAYSFANADRGGIAAGDPIHGMHLRLTVDDDLVVRAIEVLTAAGPFSICGAIAPAFQQVVGLQIGSGWRKAVLARLSGVNGCTHLTDLLLGPVTAAVLQTVAPARARRAQAPTGGSGKPALIDSCHALSSAGPVVRREWPSFYSGND